MTRSSPLIIAHRGNSSEAPENTIASIKEALTLLVDFVEIDVHLSKDGFPVVIHDPTVNRVTHVVDLPPIHKLSLSEIQQIDVGSKFNKKFAGEKIPRLLDVLQLNWKNTGLMIEIKEDVYSPKEIVGSVFRDIFSLNTPLPHLVLGSFSLEIFNEIKKQALPLKLPVEFIGIVEKLECIEPFILARTKRLALCKKSITRNLIKDLKEKGIEVWVFTVDDPKEKENLASIGVKGIISNKPKLFQ